jgi:hypothetical protein
MLICIRAETKPHISRFAGSGKKSEANGLYYYVLTKQEQTMLILYAFTLRFSLNYSTTAQVL